MNLSATPDPDPDPDPRPRPSTPTPTPPAQPRNAERPVTSSPMMRRCMSWVPS